MYIYMYIYVYIHVYICIYICIYVLYSHTPYHNDTIIKTQDDFFINICTSPFEKGYSRFACERELETEQKLQYFDPTLMAVSVVSFSFSWCSTGGPGAHSAEWRLSLLHLLSNLSGPQLNRGPRALSAWLSLPHLVYNSFSNCLTSVLTELYNSSTSTQSPTRSLESHVWSSSRRNNCHAVHRSLSSGASVYECTMGSFYLVPFHQPISAHAISSHNCH